MFNEWLTLQEKEDFLAQLESDGWKFKGKRILVAYGQSVDLYKIQKIPKTYEYEWRSLKIGHNRVIDRYKVELFDTKYEKERKDRERKDKEKKSK